MTRGVRAILATLIAAAIGIAAEPGRAAQGDSSPLAVAHIVVTVGDGAAPVSHLTADDFELWSDGVPVATRRFASEPDYLSVLLLIDASASALETWDVSVDSLTAYIPAITSGLAVNLWARDELGLGVFGRQVRFGPEFANSQEALMRLERETLRMDSRDRYGPSPIWDAVDASTDVLAARPGVRTVILVTDGRATGNHKSLSAVITRAMEADVAVSVVARGAFLMPPDVTANAPAVNLRLLADATGGLFSGRSESGLPVLFARTLNQLQHTYVLAFAPPVLDGAPHRLQVHVKKAGAQAHVRNQYWAGRTP